MESRGGTSRIPLAALAMAAQILDQSEVVTKLYELKSCERTAAHFGVTKDTIKKRLQEWGLSIDFRKKHSEEKRELEKRPPFTVGQRVLWKPTKARHGHFGAPIAYIPLEVQVMRGPTPQNYYDVIVLDPKYKSLLGRPMHHVAFATLREIEHE